MFASGSVCSIVIADILVSAVNQIDADPDEMLQGEMEQTKELVLWFAGQPISPTTFAEFEQGVQNIVREMGRKVMEFTCNECEPASQEDAPHHVGYEAGGYRRLNEKTPNRYNRH